MEDELNAFYGTTDLAAVDPADEGGDKTVIQQWHDGTIEMTLTLNGTDPISRWYIGMVRRFRRERKALLWALEHGYTVRVLCQDEDGNDGFFELTLPSHLRRAMHHIRFIPQYRIYDRYGARYTIRKGRVVPMLKWPMAERLIKEYEMKLKTVEL